MKIALCFSGQPRCFAKGFEYYQVNLLSKYGVDVFFHTWKNDENLIDEVVKLYQPKSFIITEKFQPDVVNSLYPRCINSITHPSFSTVSGFYSINESCRIKSEYEVKNGFIYDWVIRTRFDYALNLQIPFEQLDSSKLYVPACRISPERDFCNDQFAFSSSSNMNKYMSTFTFMNSYYQNGTVMNGEDMLAANLRYHNLIGDNLIYCQMNNPFPPGKYNGSWHSLLRDDMDEWVKEMNSQ